MPFTTELPSAPWYVVWISVATGAVGVTSTVVQWFRGRRSDTLSLYSTFVDDLHAELARLKAQYDSDHADWLAERRQMQFEVDELRFEVRTLRAQLGLEGTTVVDVSPEAKSQIQEVMRQMGIVPDPRNEPIKEP